jgi:flagellar hook-associated protein 3 FlgL
MSSGVAVARPSQGLAQWAEGMRANARTLMSGQRGAGMESAITDLQAADSALGQIGDALQQATQIATQMSNGTESASDRATGATSVTSFLASAIAAANAQSPSGGYLFGGAKVDTPPFDATGAYHGDGTTLSISTSESTTGAANLPGGSLASAFGALGALATALSANDQAGVQTALASLSTSTASVADARALAGARSHALQDADAARKSFETNLAQVHAQAVDADAITAASDLARSSAALQSAQAAAGQIISVTSSILATSR